MIRGFLLTLCLCWHIHGVAAEGNVRDGLSGRPVAGAIVTAGQEITTTDQEGRYELSAQTSPIKVRAIGYRRFQLARAAASSILPVIDLAPLRPKALYLSIYGIGSASLRESALKLLGETELNALVIDIKGDRGLVPYPTQVKEASLVGARSITTVQDMPGMLARLKDKDIYLIARIVSFKDDLVASSHPEWSIKTTHGERFRDREGFSWIDPFQRAAWTYLLDLAEEAAQIGFDEIQFDYVRFPDARDLRYSQPNTQANRIAAIDGFLSAARDRLARYNVFLSADVFGYIAWNTNDTNIGQELEHLITVVDYLSPMLYPSGYQYGIPGYSNPVEHPYEIVYRTLARAIARTGVSPLRFRPWLQAFKDYAFDRRLFDADEIRAQIEATERCGTDGWMLWNPRNSYAADGLYREP